LRVAAAFCPRIDAAERGLGASARTLLEGGAVVVVVGAALSTLAGFVSVAMVGS
jgi:hypothetical protein